MLQQNEKMLVALNIKDINKNQLLQKLQMNCTNVNMLNMSTSTQ